MKLTTEDELADDFRMSVERLRELRKRYRWPHVRLGRFEVRFTEAQVEQIVAQRTTKPTEASRTAVPGQTKRSAGRSA